MITLIDDELWLLDDTVLSLLLSILTPQDLARAQCVNHQWKEIGRLPHVRLAVFQNRWKVKGVKGRSNQPQFLEMVTLSHFVRRHEVIKGDSLAALALRYGSNLTLIKRLNNLISDHSLYSRDHIYIPVGDERCVEGQWVVLVHCRVAKRDLAIVCGTQEDCDRLSKGQLPLPPELGPEEQAEKLAVLLSRCLRVDPHTARFYLHDAGGDVKEAVSRFESDRQWDSTTIGPIRKAPVQQWIQGIHGL